MPNRIVREGIVTSELVNSLGWPEEVFYRRLLSIVDDFGRYHGNPSLLRAACYPLHLNKVSDSDIVKWLACVQKAGLVRVYDVEGKRYVEVIKFDQQIRAKASKYPQMLSECIADAKQVISTSTASAHLVGDGDGDAIGRSCFPEFWQAYPKKVGKGAAEKAWAKIDVSLAEKILAAVAAAQWSPEPRFIPNPATWLNEKRWEDEPPEARKRMVI